MCLQILYGAGLAAIQKSLMSNGIEMISDKVKVIDCIQLPTGRKWRMDAVASHKRLAYILQYEESIILCEILVMLDKQAKEKCFRLYLCIHDSVILEIGKTDLDEVMVIVQDCMNQYQFTTFYKNKNTNSSFHSII